MLETPNASCDGKRAKHQNRKEANYPAVVNRKKVGFELKISAFDSFFFLPFFDFSFTSLSYNCHSFCWRTIIESWIPGDVKNGFLRSPGPTHKSSIETAKLHDFFSFDIPHGKFKICMEFSKIKKPKTSVALKKVLEKTDVFQNAKFWPWRIILNFTWHTDFFLSFWKTGSMRL